MGDGQNAVPLSSWGMVNWAGTARDGDRAEGIEGAFAVTNSGKVQGVAAHPTLGQTAVVGEYRDGVLSLSLEQLPSFSTPLRGPVVDPEKVVLKGGTTSRLEISLRPPSTLPSGHTSSDFGGSREVDPLLSLLTRAGVADEAVAGIIQALHQRGVRDRAGLLKLTAKDLRQAGLSLSDSGKLLAFAEMPSPSLGLSSPTMFTPTHTPNSLRHPAPSPFEVEDLEGASRMIQRLHRGDPSELMYRSYLCAVQLMARGVAIQLVGRYYRSLKEYSRRQVHAKERTSLLKKTKELEDELRRAVQVQSRPSAVCASPEAVSPPRGPSPPRTTSKRTKTPSRATPAGSPPRTPSPPPPVLSPAKESASPSPGESRRAKQRRIKSAYPGAKVVRNAQCWKWGDQDGFDGNVGTVLKVDEIKGWVTVRWDSVRKGGVVHGGEKHTYRWGQPGSDGEDIWDVTVVPSAPRGASPPPSFRPSILPPASPPPSLLAVPPPPSPPALPVKRDEGHHLCRPSCPLRPAHSPRRASGTSPGRGRRAASPPPTAQPAPAAAAEPEEVSSAADTTPVRNDTFNSASGLSTTSSRLSSVPEINAGAMAATRLVAAAMRRRFGSVDDALDSLSTSTDDKGMRLVALNTFTATLEDLGVRHVTAPLLQCLSHFGGFVPLQALSDLLKQGSGRHVLR